MLSVLSVDVGRFGPRVVPHPRARPKPIPNVWPKLLRRGEGPPARPKPIPNGWPKLLRRGEGPPARPKPIPNGWPKLLRRGEGPPARPKPIPNGWPKTASAWRRPAAASPGGSRAGLAHRLAPLGRCGSGGPAVRTWRLLAFQGSNSLLSMAWHVAREPPPANLPTPRAVRAPQPSIHWLWDRPDADSGVGITAQCPA